MAIPSPSPKLKVQYGGETLKFIRPVYNVGDWQTGKGQDMDTPEGLHRLLNLFNRAPFLEVARSMGLVGLSSKPKEQIVAALVEARDLPLQNLLRGLNRGELKTLCRAMGLDESGREKSVLITRLVAAAGVGAFGRKSTAEPPSKSKDTEANDSESGKVKDYRHDEARRKKEAFEALRGLKSLRSPPGNKIAVKVTDHRGNETLQVFDLSSENYETPSVRPTTQKTKP